MNTAVLIQQVYPGLGFEPLLELTKAHHQAYCDKWNIDYQPIVDNVTEHDPALGAYAKIELIRRAMAQDYAYIIWLDADTLIKDVDADLRDAVPYQKIGVCWHRIPQLQHWNVGALYVHNCEATQLFMDEWIKAYPPPRDGWNEQGVFNRMAMKQNTVVTISDKWNATLNYSMVPDAVVLGFHGQGNAVQRLQIMRDAYNTLFPEQKAQGTAEVTDDS